MLKWYSQIISIAFQRMVTNSNSLSSFFKEKAWYARGGEDSNFDYNNPLSNAGAGSEGGDPPEFNPFKKSHWDRVRAIGGWFLKSDGS